MAHRYDPFRPDPRLRMDPIPRLGRDAAVGQVTILAYVDRYVPMVNAGAEWMLHAMLQDSARRGHRVIVATPCTDEPLVVDGVEVYPVREGLRAAAEAEVVVGHLLFTREAVAHARLARLPLLYLVHNHDQLRAWSITGDDVSALVWNSEWIGHEGRYLQDVRRVPATTVRPPLDLSRYSAENFAHTDLAEREFVTLVNPIPAKGSDMFYALARRFPRARFLAVEGAYGTQQRPQLQDRNVEWQRQTGDIARDVYARTRVLLMPSHYESWGRVACEALCSGIPVIAAPTPGLSEALAGGATFVDHDDVEGWAAALAALDDPDEYARASARAIARAIELDELARLDLDRWDRLVRLAAGGTRVRSGRMTTTPVDTYDPFRGSKRRRPAEEVPAPPADAPEVGAVAEFVAWLGEVDGMVRSVEIQRAWVPMDDAGDDTEWEGLMGVAIGPLAEAGATDVPLVLGLGDVLDALTEEWWEDDPDGDPDRERTYRAVIEAANGDVLTIMSPALPVMDDEAVEDERQGYYEQRLADGLSETEAGADAWPRSSATPRSLDAVAPGASIPPDGGPEAPTAQEGAQAAAEPEEWQIPAKAVDIVHALGTEQDPEEARRRAELVKAAEEAKPEPRVSVMAAAAKILG